LIKKLKIRKQILPFALAGSVTLITLSGCNKTMDCDIDYPHMHKYISEEGFETFKDSEYETDSDMNWTNEITKPNKEQKEMDQFDLLKIEDNRKALEKDTKNDLPHVVYEYKHRYSTPIRVGKITTHAWHTSYKLTTDANHSNLTGYVRDVSFKYRGYKIAKDEEGNLQAFSSGLVDNLFDIEEEYPYFKVSDYKEKIYSKKYEKPKGKVK